MELSGDVFLKIWLCPEEIAIEYYTPAPLAEEKKLDYEDLGRGIAWFDAGEPERILEISNFISLIENKQGQMIGCIEEIALRNKFITKRQFLDNIKFYRNSSYADYLKTLILWK